MNDTEKKDQPVSIEDEIESVIASGEEVKDDEAKEDTTAAKAESEESAEESEEVAESEEVETGQVDDEESDDSEDDADEAEEGSSDDDLESKDDNVDGDSDESTGEHGEGSEKLEAPEHWAAADREVFNNQTPEAQEWLLKRHREMEGAMTRKSQELASKTRQFDAVQDALSPYEAEFAAAGLDYAGAVRQLAHWHQSLKTGGKEAILQLVNMYNIDMDEDDLEDDPALSSIKQELSTLKRQTAQQQQAAQQEQQNQLKRVIDDFAAETDETGKLKHPHFNTLYDDITKLFTAGLASDLPEAYNKALAFRPELSVVKPAAKTVTKQDQATKVKKAKKAATGIKSSGATKRKRAEMSLEDEIAAQL